MLVKVNGIISSGKRKKTNEREEERRGGENRYIKVTLLDIDDLGSIIPLKELELRLPSNDRSVAKTLRSSRYAAIFTERDNKGSDTITVANGITEEELNKEKEKTIDKMNNKIK